MDQFIGKYDPILCWYQRALSVLELPTAYLHSSISNTGPATVARIFLIVWGKSHLADDKRGSVCVRNSVLYCSLTTIYSRKRKLEIDIILIVVAMYQSTTGGKFIENAVS